MGPTAKSMSPLTRETLALRLRQNWLAKHPLDAVAQPQPVDDSLTSLSWLQNLNIMKMTTNPTPPSSPVSDKQQRVQISQFSSNAQVNPNAILNMTNLSGNKIKQEPGVVTTTPVRTISGIEISPPHGGTALDKTDYKTNPHIKPPYSYATLICMAMRESSKNKITLAGIYNWITENFMYYRVADPSWQNSIRHNLSLNKCFQKVPRRKDEPGKGGFWRINPEFEDMFVNGIFKKRRCSPISPRDPIIAQPPAKKFKPSNDDSNSSMASLSGLATATAVQSILTPMNSIEDCSSEPAVIQIKQEPKLTASSIFRQMAGPDISDTIDFSWNSILNQDIEVGGVKVKTEDLLNDADPVSNSITALSPPPSEDSSDISLEDLLNTEFGAEPDEALDFENGNPLDLTVTGVTLKAPQWWEESINGKQSFMSPNSHSRMSTPVTLDTELDYTHPWAEDKQNSDPYADSFDKDFTNLFDMLEQPSVDS